MLLDEAKLFRDGRLVFKARFPQHGDHVSMIEIADLIAVGAGLFDDALQGWKLFQEDA